MRVMTRNRRNDPPYVSGDDPSGDQFEIVANHPNVATDVFTFTSVAGTVSKTQSLADVAKINVFPNLYLGFSNTLKRVDVHKNTPAVLHGIILQRHRTRCRL